MWKSIKPVLGQILSSKKALALIAGAIVWALAQAGVAANPSDVLPLLGFVASYMLGQGIADHGKERAKVIAESVASEAALGKQEGSE